MANTAHPFYEGALLTNHLLYQETDSTQYLTESFDLAERSKALLLYQSIQEADALQYAGIPGSLLEREYNLRIDLSYYDQKRQERLSEGLEETDSTVLSISSKLFDLNQSYDSLKTHFEEEYPEYYRLKYDLSTISVEEIQKELLNPDQSLLEFFVGDSTIFIFLLSQKDYDVIQVRKDTAIEAWVSQLRRGLKAPYNSEEPEDSPYRNSSYSAQQYADAAVKLYDKLIAPVKDKLQPKVIIIPDGVLGYLPFQALLEEMPARPYRFHTHSYFGREHQLSYSYSATLLKEMQNKVHRAEPGKSLLAMAPFYDGTLYTLDSLYKAELAELELEESLATTARSAFESLPYSGAEAYTASQLWDGDFLQGDEATEQHFREMAGQYRMLHLATHGAANDEVGEYAYLAFTEVDDSLENELLFVKDIYNLQLNADLVILSACQTATGELQRGEGIISLARAFAYAGAKSITTTLWSVNDQKTK
ncbi:MAG: CHAT domain-containing protein, partial [Candidatus Omnitrophica bacterium]|nr:CHAT domain-containing protein [Candidatus Omnitrophota bacterium]